MAALTQFSSGEEEKAYIERRARELGLDPKAVLAVAATEGGGFPAGVGDHGTSFGPWQLHAGGALPAEVWSKGADYAKQWADTQEGINYALGRIATVARGQTGPTAISSIVTRFERPANPDAEIQTAVSIYNGTGYSRAPISPTPIQKTGPGLGDAAGGFIGDVLHPFKSIVDVYQFLTSWRFAEIIGGFALLLLGLYLLGRHLGVAPPPGALAMAAA